MFPKAGWKKDLKSREKAMKRSTWFRGRKDEESWEDLPKRKSGGGIEKKRRKTFQKAGERRKPGQTAATVMFVPSTRGSMLIRSLKEDEDMMAGMTGFRVKYQEAGGSILANAFNKNLGSDRSCGREECPPCRKPEGRGKCKARNIVYESKCVICNPATSHEEVDRLLPSGSPQVPREGIYLGETSRSLHERALEHERDARTFSAKSHIVKHWMNTHPDLPDPPEMEFTISARFRDCLSRQIGEALKINFSNDILLNSKAEYHSNSLNRITIQEDAWEQRLRGRQEEEEEEQVKRSVEEFKKRKVNTPEPVCEGGLTMSTLTGSQELYEPCEQYCRSSVSPVNNIVDVPPQADYSTDEGEFECGRPAVPPADISGPVCEGGGTMSTLTSAQELCEPCEQYCRSSVSPVSNIVDVPPQADYSTDEGEFDRAVPISDRTLYTAKVPENKKNTARRRTAVPRGRLPDYDLYYFNLWWRRMEVESRKEQKETLRREDEARRAKWKRKFLITLSGETQSREKISPVVFSEPEVHTGSFSNYLRAGDVTIPGVALEGVGVMVPETDDININIYEQPQDSRQVKKRVTDGTRGSTTGTELGLTAEVGRVRDQLTERESSFA